MTPRCCLPHGYPNERKAELLARLAAAGATLPEDAQVYGPRDGWQWRVVDGHGREVGVYGRASIRQATRPDVRLTLEDGVARLTVVGPPRSIPDANGGARLP